MRDRAVEKSQRVREGNRAVDVHAIAVADAPHGAGKIAESVGGEKRGAFEGGNKKTAGQVRLVMLDAMKFRFEFARVDVERGGQSFGNAGERGQDFGALPCERGHAQGIKQFGEQARVGIARNGDVIDVGESEAGFLEAVANGLHGKTGGVFYAIEALFFDGGDQLAVADDRGGSVAVVGIDSQNVHERRSVYPSSADHAAR